MEEFLKEIQAIVLRAFRVVTWKFSLYSKYSRISMFLPSLECYNKVQSGILGSKLVPLLFSLPFRPLLYQGKPNSLGRSD